MAVEPVLQLRWEEQLAGYVSEQTAYHHGEASLHAAIVNLDGNHGGVQVMHGFSSASV